MRLAVFTNKFPNHVSTFFARDMCALQDAGVEIDIFSFYPLDPNLWQFVPERLRGGKFQTERVHHLSLVQSIGRLTPWSFKTFYPFCQDVAAVSCSAGRFGAKPLAKSLYVALKAWAWSQQSQNQYDHILAYWGNYSATCAYLFQRLSRKSTPFSLFLHAGTDLYRDQVYLKEKLLYADNIFTVCEYNKQFIKNLYPDIFHLIEPKISLHHLGVNFGSHPIGLKGRPSRKVLAVGRLEKKKGFEYLLYAANELKQRGYDIKVELIGDGADRSRLESLAKRMNIAESVTFRGWLKFDEVKSEMENATLLVHPSSELGDAVPTVIKESMAVGTPVIASDIAGIPELLDYGRCGILTPPKDVKALANAIQMLSKDEMLRHKYASVAREYAEKMFDQVRNGKKLAELLRTTKIKS